MFILSFYFYRNPTLLYDEDSKLLFAGVKVKIFSLINNLILNSQVLVNIAVFIVSYTC